jgi:hypothetical protein
MAEHLLVAQLPAVLVARVDDQAQHVARPLIRGRRAPLGDQRQQHAAELVARVEHAAHVFVVALLRPDAVADDEGVEELLQPLDLGAATESGQRGGGHVEGDLPDLLVEVHLAALGPASRAIGDHLLDQREIGFQVGVGEGGIPHLAMAAVLGLVHIEQPVTQQLADDGRPPPVVAEGVAVGVQDEAVGLRPDQVHRLEPGVGSGGHRPAEDGAELHGLARQDRGEMTRHDVRLGELRHRHLGETLRHRLPTFLLPAHGSHGTSTCERPRGCQLPRTRVSRHRAPAAACGTSGHGGGLRARRPADGPPARRHVSGTHRSDGRDSRRGHRAATPLPRGRGGSRTREASTAPHRSWRAAGSQSRRACAARGRA